MPPESAPSTLSHRLPVVALLALLLVGGALPGAALGIDPAAFEERPGVHYEEALAHAGDEIAFTPGARVLTGFSSKARALATNGGSVTRLPAGLLSGRQMAAGSEAARSARLSRVLTEASPGATAAPVPVNPNTTPDPSAAPSPAATPDPNASPGQDPAASPAPTPVAPPATGPGGLRRQVIGFLPYWELNSAKLTLRYDVLSTIAYFGVGADTAGNLQKQNADGSLTTGWAGWTSDRMTSIIEAAHAAGTRVVLTITVFAWTTSDRNRQAALLGSPSARANLARQLAGAVRDRGADGVNVDFEPIVTGYGDEFTDFVRLLRAEFDAIAPGYEITVDTTGYVGNYELANLVAPGAADAIFLMGYDFRTSGADNAGAIAPISGEIYDVADAIGSFLRYIPPSALIVGVPYYGRAWSTVSDEPNARTQTGTRYGSSVATEYQTAATLAEENGRRYDSVEQSAWTAYRKQNCSSTYGCVTTWRELYYDDPESLGAKYDLVNQLGLRGMGMWALGYDGTRPELWDVLAEKFLVPTIPTAGPPLTLHASSSVVTWGDTIVLTPHLGGTAAGRTVDLQSSSDTVGWGTFAQLTLGADGQVVHPVDGMVNRFFRAQTVDPATGQITTTEPLRVVVRTISLLRPTNGGKVRAVARGTQVDFRTTVRPARSDYPIPMVRFVAYRLISGAWTQVAQQDIVPDATGVAVVPFTFDAPGSWYVRSQALPTPFNANSGWSPVERYNVH